MCDSTENPIGLCANKLRAYTWIDTVIIITAPLLIILQYALFEDRNDAMGSTRDKIEITLVILGCGMIIYGVVGVVCYVLKQRELSKANRLSTENIVFICMRISMYLAYFAVSLLCLALALLCLLCKSEWY